MATGGGGASTLADRLPPQNLEAERSVLGGCLLDAAVIDDVMTFLRPEDFYRDAHGIVYRRLCEMRGRGCTPDAVTLAEELEAAGDFDRIGGDDGLAEIANSVPHAANARYHAEIVRQKAVVRGTIQAATEIIRDGYSGLLTASELVAAAESRIFGLREREVAGRSAAIADVVGEAMAGVERRGAGGSPGILTGLDDLDAVLGGLKPEEVTILGARPSMGKTALGLRIAMGAAATYGEPVLFSSLEMGRISLVNRMLAAEGRIDSRKIERNRDRYRLVEADLDTLNRTAYRLATTPMFIDDSPVQSVGRIAAAARRIKRRDGLGLVMIDYLGLIDGERQRGESRQEEVARISRGLKAAARETKVPWVVLHQLNRENEKRGDKRPCMADLRESGQVEADADVILLLHRPAYYDPDDKPGVAEVIVAKNRNGPTEAVELSFEGRFTRFDNLARQFGPPGHAGY